jgi:hypothetical protein
MYVIRTNIYLHVQITYKIFVRIPNTESWDVDSMTFGIQTLLLCSDSEHGILRCRFNNIWNPNTASMFGIWTSISKHGEVKRGHVGRSKFNCGLSAPGRQRVCWFGEWRNKARYASKMNLITVKVHPRIDTSEKWARSLSCSVHSKSMLYKAQIWVHPWSSVHGFVCVQWLQSIGE